MFAVIGGWHVQGATTGAAGDAAKAGAKAAGTAGTPASGKKGTPNNGAYTR